MQRSDKVLLAQALDCLRNKIHEMKDDSDEDLEWATVRLNEISDLALRLGLVDHYILDQAGVDVL